MRAVRRYGSPRAEIERVVPSIVEPGMTEQRPVRANDAQHAALALRIGKHMRMRAEVAVTPLGLLSIGALVSSILLSSAVIVRAARHDR